MSITIRSEIQTATESNNIVLILVIIWQWSLLTYSTNYFVASCSASDLAYRVIGCIMWQWWGGPCMWDRQRLLMRRLPWRQLPSTVRGSPEIRRCSLVRHRRLGGRSPVPVRGTGLGMVYPGAVGRTVVRIWLAVGLRSRAVWLAGCRVAPTWGGWTAGRLVGKMWAGLKREIMT